MGKAKNLDILRNSPLYNQAEASLYLGIPRTTLRYWAFGEKRSSHFTAPILKVPTGSIQLSFFNLIELHVINSIRQNYNIDLPKVRKALNYLKDKLGSERPLLDEDFETDGVSLFVDRYGNLINVSSQGQQAMRSILKSSLKRIQRDSQKIPIKLFPYTHSKIEDSPEVISMTPSIFSGRPVIDGTGISTAIIAERYKAGDSVDHLAKDYKIAKIKIEEAIRCELQRAA